MDECKPLPDRLAERRGVHLSGGHIAINCRAQRVNYRGRWRLRKAARVCQFQYGREARGAAPALHPVAYTRPLLSST